MSVVLETTLGDITIDLFLKERPRASLNFLKLCKMKYFNYNLFHTISRGFIAQTGDPSGSRNGGESVFGVIEGPLKRYFEAETNPRMKHTMMGLVSFVGTDDNMIGSQFFITLGSDLTYLDGQHCIFGEVMEGLDVLELLNETICDQDNRPYQDVRITHTVVLEDPFPDPQGLPTRSRSPSPSTERLQGGRIAPDEDIDETQGKSVQEINEIIATKEAKARATILEMIGDIPDADMAPPENVLFVCKLNPVTTDDDLEIIFSRFGKIKSCEVIRDRKTNESLQYAFVEFEERKACEDAYFKMDNVLIDDRRIHVDFSQSVAKVKWHGKGRGVTTYDEKGRMSRDKRNDLGSGRYSKNLSNIKRENYDSERSLEKQSRNGSGSKIRERSAERRYEHKKNNRDYYHKKNNDENTSDYKYKNEYRDSYQKRERSYEHEGREKYSGKYDSHQSRSYKNEYRNEERKSDKKYHRSRSPKEVSKYSGNKGDYNYDEKKTYKDDKEKYNERKANDEKVKSKYKSKDVEHKPKSHRSSSDKNENSSDEDNSKHERRKSKKKRKSKHSSTSDEENTSRQIKKKKKSKKKKHRTSSSEED